MLEVFVLVDVYYYFIYCEMCEQVVVLVYVLWECGVQSGDSVVVVLLWLVFLILVLYGIVEVGVVWLLLDIGYFDDWL